jgi:5-methylcytosine-specific restriction endonuclease McrA
MAYTEVICPHCGTTTRTNRAPRLGAVVQCSHCNNSLKLLHTRSDSSTEVGLIYRPDGRPHGWDEIRRKVLARDHNQCLRCGSTQQLTVHHKNPSATSNDHSLANLETLCAKCHSKEPGRGHSLLTNFEDRPRQVAIGVRAWAWKARVAKQEVPCQMCGKRIAIGTEVYHEKRSQNPKTLCEECMVFTPAKKISRIQIERARRASLTRAHTSARRRDQQKQGTKSDCFVATACFNDASHPTVIILRKYRDARLTKSAIGRAFISRYYLYGPSLAKLVIRRPILKLATRFILGRLAHFLQKVRQVR